MIWFPDNKSMSSIINSIGWLVGWWILLLVKPWIILYKNQLNKYGLQLYNSTKYLLKLF